MTTIPPGDPNAGMMDGQLPVQARMVAQYIKDLSFENPNIERLLSGPGDDPNLKVEVNVNARPVADKLYETAINFSAKAESKAGLKAQRPTHPRGWPC